MGYLSGRDNAYLLALINNDDSGGALSEDARRELAARGALPSWASGRAVTPSISDVPDANDAAATPIVLEPMAGARNTAINVDGVNVPAVLGADGQPLGDGQYYRVRDVNAARAQAQEDRMAAEWDRQAKKDIADYGTRQLYAYDYNEDGSIKGVSAVPSTGLPGTRPLSAEEEAQQDRLGARRAVEARQAQQNKALAMHPSRVALADKQDARRALVAANAMLAGGSNNLNPAMRAQIGALRMANDPTTNPDVARSLRYTLPGGRLAAEVDRANAEAAMDIVKRQNIGALFNRDVETAAGLRAEQRMQELRQAAGEAAENAMGGYKRAAAERALIVKGADAAEREMILLDIFGPVAGQPAMPGQPESPRGPASPMAPLPLPDGHNHPVRVPDGTYPMM